MAKSAITYVEKGDFKKITSKLENIKEALNIGILDKYGKLGVEALRQVTPIETGRTAASWYYEIENNSHNSAALYFCNSNIQNGINVALVIQMGHATQSGCWIEGYDYINPALQPIFEEMCDEIWREVMK